MSSSGPMACPTPAGWRGLVAHRLDPRREEPAGWPEAREHLAACPECRRAALAADPTLVFLRLPERPAERPASSSAASAAFAALEVAEVRRAVAAMRTASRLTGESRPAPLATWKRWGAAAVLAGAALLTGRDGGTLSPAVRVTAVPAALGALEAEAVLPGGDGARPQMIEELEQPAERVLQMDSPDFPIVMLYGERMAGV